MMIYKCGNLAFPNILMFYKDLQYSVRINTIEYNLNNKKKTHLFLLFVHRPIQTAATARIVLRRFRAAHRLIAEPIDRCNPVLLLLVNNPVMLLLLLLQLLRLVHPGIFVVEATIRWKCSDKAVRGERR